MQEPFALGARLQICADFVKEGSRLADIGTDHGYLPVWLIKTGRISEAIAADINKVPLESAVKTAEKYRVKLRAVLSNGFENIQKEEVDTAVIAGMGGELIGEIICGANWLKASGVTLVLQPMTKAAKLREYLYKEGFEINREEAVEENGKLYSVIKASYTGKSVNDSVYMGKIIPGSNCSERYAVRVIKDLLNRCKGLKGEELGRTQKIIDEIRRGYLTDVKSL